MSEPRGFDLDGETDRAWSAFTRRLADRLSDMGGGETLTLGLSGASHACQPGTARLLFSVPSEGELRRTEIAADDKVTAEHDRAQRDADQLAAESVRLLMDRHGIVHPAFLSVAGESYDVGEDDEPDQRSRTPTSSRPPSSPSRSTPRTCSSSRSPRSPTDSARSRSATSTAT